MPVFEVLAATVVAFWIMVHLDWRRRWPTAHVLESQSPGAPSPSRDRVTVVIPARDEAVVLPRTLPGLLQQEDDLETIILVDDRSTDGTGAHAEEIAKKNNRAASLQVITKDVPPPGWSGKVHAMQAGIDHIERQESPLPEWILFTDADIQHHTGSLRALIDKSREGPFDLVSVMARLHAQSFWERLLIPPFVYFFQLLYPFRLVSRATSRVAAAAGGCVLIRREALEKAGGLHAIRGALIDDVALARAVKRAGGRTWLGFDPEIVSIRSYPRLAELWKMISRCAFDQLGYRFSLLVLTLLGLGLFFVSPPLLALAGGIGLLLPSIPTTPATVTLAGALLAWALQSVSLLPSVIHHRVPKLYALGLPFAALLYGAMTWSSAWNHYRGRGSEWKGRTFEGDTRPEDQGSSQGG